jgi:hypothetical protein
MYQVREIIMFGWTENFSTQGPEHCHIDFCKNLADCTNNKDIFLTLLRWHVRAAHLQYLRSLEVDMADAGDQDDDPGLSVVTGLEADRNDGISCELGIRYPTLQSIMAGQRNHLSIQVHDMYHDIYHSIYHSIYHAIYIEIYHGIYHGIYAYIYLIDIYCDIRGKVA